MKRKKHFYIIYIIENDSTPIKYQRFSCEMNINKKYPNIEILEFEQIEKAHLLSTTPYLVIIPHGLAIYNILRPGNTTFNNVKNNNTKLSSMFEKSLDTLNISKFLPVRKKEAFIGIADINNYDNGISDSDILYFLMTYPKDKLNYIDNIFYISSDLILIKQLSSVFNNSNLFSNPFSLLIYQDEINNAMPLFITVSSESPNDVLIYQGEPSYIDYYSYGLCAKEIKTTEEIKKGYVNYFLFGDKRVIYDNTDNFTFHQVSIDDIANSLNIPVRIHPDVKKGLGYNLSGMSIIMATQEAYSMMPYL